ncbi:hypothetical protein CDD83_4760 [Cordyceps sp. RAO-2017]|nr:hypothetical protein CDD83_4760 [Cordyceps sp. RAO-2017]
MSMSLLYSGQDRHEPQLVARSTSSQASGPGIVSATWLYSRDLSRQGRKMMGDQCRDTGSRSETRRRGIRISN